MRPFSTHRIFSVFLIICLICLSVFGITVVGGAYILSNGKRLQTIARKDFGLAVQFKRYTMHMRGLNPFVMAQDLTIAKLGSKPVLSFKDVSVSFNIWDSILFFRPVTQTLSAKGVFVSLDQSRTGKYHLHGFESTLKSVTWPLFIQEELFFLAPQHSMLVKNAFIKVNRSHASNLDLTHLDIQWNQNAPQNYTFNLTTELPNAKGHFHLMANVFGHLTDRKSVHAKVYMRLDGKNLGQLINPNLKDTRWQNLNGGLQFWIQVSHGHMTKVHSVVHFKNLNVLNLKTLYEYKFASFGANMEWAENEKGWTFLARPTQCGKDASTASTDYFLISKKNMRAQKMSVLARVDRVNLGWLDHVVALYTQGIKGENAHIHQASELLSHLKPVGYLKNLKFKTELLNGRLSRYILRAQFSALGESHDGSYPGFKALNGRIYADNSFGEMTFYSKDFILSHNDLFPENWPKAKISGKMTWYQKPGGWLVNIMPFKYHSAHLKGYLVGQVKLNQQDLIHSRLSVLGGFKIHNGAKHIKPYLPQKYLSAKLFSWLTHHLLTVPVGQAQLLIRGKVSDIPFNHQHGVFEVLGQAKHSSLLPWEGWPTVSEVNGYLDFHNQHFKAITSHWKMRSSVGKKVVFYIPNIAPSKASYFSIKGTLKDTGTHLQDIILHSPLKQKLLFVPKLQLLGPVKIRVNMRFPLANVTRKNQIEGEIIFNHNQMSFPDSPVWLKKLHGVIHYQGYTLTSPAPLQAVLLNEPWRINFKPNQVSVYGLLNMSKLSHKISNPIFKGIAGKAHVDANIMIQPTETQFSIMSDLSHVWMNFPKPFNKAYNQKMDLTIKGVSSGALTQFKVSVGKMLGAKVKVKGFGRHAKIDSLVALFPSSPIPNPTRQGIYISGKLPYLACERWMDMFNTLGGKSSQFHFNSANVSVNLFKVLGNVYHHVKVKISPQAHQTLLQIDGDKIQGTINIPQAVHSQHRHPLTAHFTKLYVKSSTRQQPIHAKWLSHLPSLAISIHDLYWNGKKMGALSFTSYPIAGGIKIPNARLLMKTLQAKMTGKWFSHDAQDHVNVNITARGHNVGLAFKSLGYPGVMSGGSGAIIYQGSWPGSLFHPNIKKMNGQISFDLSHGHIEGVNQGFSRLFGFFSVESIARHLSFNFSDLDKKGMAFDTLTGLYHLKNGIATTNNLKIENPSLRVNLNGSINIPDKTMNQYVVALPNVDAGVAVAAGLLGGPIVGVAAWVADKILTNTILKNRGMVYHLKGSWGNEKAIKGKTQ